MRLTSKYYQKIQQFFYVTLGQAEKRDEATKPSPTTTTSAAPADASASDSSIPRSGAGISDGSSAARLGTPAPSGAIVGRAMSSGEDSSAESEPGKADKKPTLDNTENLDVQPAKVATRPRSNSCTEVIGPKEAKVEVSGFFECFFFFSFL